MARRPLSPKRARILAPVWALCGVGGFFVAYRIWMNDGAELSRPFSKGLVRLLGAKPVAVWCGLVGLFFWYAAWRA